MNIFEALELNKTIATFHGKNPQPLSRFRIFETLNLGGGYALCINASSVSEEYLSFLKCLAKTRRLGIREFRGYLVISSS
jgi:hypothetical protein